MDKYKKKYKLKMKKRGCYNRGNTKMQKQRYYKKYPEKRLAHNTINHAIERNEIIRPTACPLCKKDVLVVAHHDNYGKIFDIKWMCVDCHNIKHGKGRR